MAYNVFVHANKVNPITQKDRRKRPPWHEEADYAVAIF